MSIFEKWCREALSSKSEIMFTKIECWSLILQFQTLPRWHYGVVEHIQHVDLYHPSLSWHSPCCCWYCPLTTARTGTCLVWFRVDLGHFFTIHITLVSWVALASVVSLVAIIYHCSGKLRVLGLHKKGYKRCISIISIWARILLR